MSKKDNPKRTPLSWATERGNTETAKILIKEGANIESKEVGGSRPLCWTIYSDREDFIKLLLTGKQRLSTRSKPPVKHSRKEINLSILSLKNSNIGYVIDSSHKWCQLCSMLKHYVYNRTVNVTFLYVKEAISARDDWSTTLESMCMVSESMYLQRDASWGILRFRLYVYGGHNKYRW